MRTLFVLALLLSVAIPRGVWHASVEASYSQAAATAAMASPATALWQLVRDSAKADKTFSSGWLPASHRALPIPLLVDSDHPLAHASLLHAIAIDCPPLSPRPPPAA